jgi:HK97 family phage major capsid protein
MPTWIDKKKMDELNAERNAHIEKVQAIGQKMQAENRGLTDAEKPIWTESMAKIKDLDARMEALNAAAALELTTPTPGRADVKPEENKLMKRYSLMRAINRVLEGKPLDGVEGEMNAEMATRMGRQPRNSFFLPMAALEQRSGEITLAGSSYVKATEVGAPILSLRNALVMGQLGATIISGLVGDLSFPKQNANGAAYWIDGETGTLTKSTPTLGAQVLLQPSVVGAYVDATRKFLAQSSIDAETWLRNELMLTLALEIDRACINGSGTGSEPEGILQNSSVGSVAIGATGGAMTWAKWVELETTVSVANAAMGRLAYLTNSKVIGKLKTTPKTATYGDRMIMDDADGNRANGYPVAVTNAVPSNLTKSITSNCSSAIFGNFADLLIGFWSAVDLLVDPYTGGTAGLVRLIAMQDCDIQLRRAESFASCDDIVTT